MANEIITTKEALPETRQRKKSVISADDQIVQFFAPFYGLEAGALPKNLPSNSYYGFFRPRDILLLSTPNKEDNWASALSKAIAKVSSQSWQVDSEIPIRRKRAQEWIHELGAGYGLFSFDDFIGSHLSSFLLLGAAFVEIEREANSRYSRVINLHHLNPLRCRLTGNAKTPVHYLGDDSKVRPLEWWQVMVITDRLLPGNGADNYEYYEGAAERSYNTIRNLSYIESFIGEKVSGRRPLELNFVGGISRSSLDDALKSLQMEADKKALMSYMGAAIVPVLSDQPVTNVSIPIASLPDITDVERERRNARLIYANNIGLDPQDLDPALVGRQGLGSTGNQSQVLADKQQGSLLAKWAKSFTSKLNQHVLDTSTSFSFIETDLRDQAQEADNRKKRADWRKVMIDAGEITPKQSVNIAVDDGDLPREFLETDATGADTLRDDQKPETPEEMEERESRERLEGPKERPAGEEGNKKKERRDPWTEIYH